MLPAKIRLTDHIIHIIKTTRITNRIPAAMLARAIKRDDSYISSLESKRLRNISSTDFIAILCFLFNISEHMAIAKAEELINPEKKADIYPSQSFQDIVSGINNGANTMSVNQPSAGYHWYDASTGYIGNELISDMLKDITELITDIYRKNPKETVYALNSFIKTMRFDPVFAMSVMGMPFFSLKILDTNERDKVLADLSLIIQKYAETVNQK